MTKVLFSTAILAAALAACGSENISNQVEADSIEPPQSGQELLSSDGNVIGNVAATDDADAVMLTITANGLEAGEHGLHLHATGTCNTPDFKSAGDHWNPGDKAHGRDNPDGQHLGDLPNLVIGDDGRADLSVTVAGASLAQMADEDGTALVIHAGPDDYRTDPSGDSGARIACAVLAPPVKTTEN